MPEPPYSAGGNTVLAWEKGSVSLPETQKEVSEKIQSGYKKH